MIGNFSKRANHTALHLQLKVEVCALHLLLKVEVCDSSNVHTMLFSFMHLGIYLTFV